MDSNVPEFPSISLIDESEEDYQWFEAEFEKLYGIQLNLYKEKQMKRRINTLIIRKGLKSYGSFMNLLRTDTRELKTFIDYITINVTEFFRTPNHWSVLENEILPQLIEETNHRLKIWSCACSTGEEPYSVVMSLMKHNSANRARILATDIDHSVLARAQKGIFDARNMEDVPEDILKRFFARNDNMYSISNEVKSRVEFSQLDLLKDAYPADCDLILCRNVLIYFTEEAKEKIYAQFKQSLRPGGFLFTGNAEQIVFYKKYGFKKVRNFIYQNV